MSWRVLALLAALASSGCLVISLHPIYDESSLAFDEALLGRWENAEDRVTLAVERAEWKSYRLAYTDRTGALSLTGRLAMLGDDTLLDVTPASGVDAGFFLIPAHGMFRVQVSDATLTAEALDYDWFADAVERRALRKLAATMDTRQNVVLTSSTADLRAWLLARRKTGRPFGAEMTFTRRKDPQP